MSLALYKPFTFYQPTYKTRAKIIADCLIDFFDEQLRVLENTRTPSAIREVSEMRGTLAQLSLAQREWNYPAQKVLFRRVVINSDEVMDFLDDSESIAENWIKQVVFEYDLRDSALSSNEQLSTMFDLMKRTPAVKSLDLVADNLPHLTITRRIQVHKLLPHLAKWSGLTHLHFSAPFSKFMPRMIPNLLSICFLVPKLENLESLSIQNWASHQRDPPFLPDTLYKLLPPKTLKKFAFEACSNMDGCRFEKYLLWWLIAKRGKYSLKDLSIKLIHDLDKPLPWSNFSALLRIGEDLEQILRYSAPALNSLHVHFEGHRSNHNFFRRILPRQKKLKFLHLDNLTLGFISLNRDLSLVQGESPFIPKLPRSLEHIEVDWIPDERTDPDSHGVLRELLRNNSGVFRALKTFTTTTEDPTAVADLQEALADFDTELIIRDRDGKARVVEYV